MKKTRAIFAILFTVIFVSEFAEGDIDENSENLASMFRENFAEFSIKIIISFLFIINWSEM